MKTIVYLVFSLFVLSANGQQKIFSVYFQNDEYQLDADDIQIIQEAAAFMAQPGITASGIQINGHTDAPATADYNVALSNKRALVVKELFQSKIKSDIKISLAWHGELIPEATTDLHYGQRCADIVITYTEQKQIVQVPKSDINDLWKQLREPSQVFTINPQKDTLIMGEEGTIINIPAGAFIIPDEKQGRQVNIVLEEYYDYASMIINNMTTMSNGLPLETGGMIYVNAFLDNRALTVMEDKPLTFMFPGDTMVTGMQFFTGNTNPTGNMNWLLTETDLETLTPDEYHNLIYPMGFTKKRYRKNCPYLFCGLREDLGADNKKYYEKRAYMATDWKAYRKYTDSLCLVYGVRNFGILKRMLLQQVKQTEDPFFYVAKTSRLGYMNCDKFYKLPPEKLTLLALNEAPAENVNSFLVFSKYKSLMLPNTNNPEKAEFSNIAKKSKCKAVVIKYENKIAYLSVQELKAGDVPEVTPEFVAMTPTQLKTELKKLK